MTKPKKQYLTLEEKKAIAEEKKQIAEYFIKLYQDRYPNWNDLTRLPRPLFPSKLKDVDLSQKRLPSMPFTKIELSVLLGTVLGDTSFSIQKKYKNARFQLKHSTRQFTWFMWKACLLNKFTNLSGVCYSYPSGYQLNSPKKPNEKFLGKLNLASEAHETLTVLYKTLCGSGKVPIQRFWLNYMTNYFLMTLWLDDGSLYNGRQGCICLDNYPRQQQRILQRYLLTMWGIQTYTKATGKTTATGETTYRIHFTNQQSLVNFLAVIAPVVPVKEMLYKVCFVPVSNPGLLQRWKTELKRLVKPEFVEYIEYFYENIAPNIEARRKELEEARVKRNKNQVKHSV